MEFWCRVTADGVPRLGLRRDEQILIHEGDLFSKPKPTGQQVSLDKAEWLPPASCRRANRSRSVFPGWGVC